MMITESIIWMSWFVIADDGGENDADDNTYDGDYHADDADNTADNADENDADIYIMVRCLSRKCLLFVHKIWSFLTFIATFRTQRNWSFPCFLTHSVLKGIGRFHVS